MKAIQQYKLLKKINDFLVEDSKSHANELDMESKTLQKFNSIWMKFYPKVWISIQRVVTENYGVQHTGSFKKGDFILIKPLILEYKRELEKLLVTKLG